MSVPATSSVCAVRGQALDIEVTVPDEADLSVATIEFGIAPNEKSAYLFTLTTSFSGQVITGTMTEAQSLQLIRSQYYFSCWVTIESDPTPVAVGWLRLTPDPRNQ